MSTIFVTMVYNDRVFLDIWVRYYSQHTERKNLHIITHGSDQDYAHEIGKGCKILECPRDPHNPHLDQDRFKFINEYCSELTKEQDRVIYNDVDEIVVLDPDCREGLVEYIENVDTGLNVITPLGLEIVHMKQLENDYDFKRTLFSQRKYIRMNAWYTKPCITNIPITWGPDGHGCSHDKLYIDDNLYLFHLKWFDDQFHVNRHKERLKLRFKGEKGEEVIVGAGSWSWSERTYQLVTNSFLRMRMDPLNEGFEFTRHKKRMYDSFKGGGGPLGNLHKVDWFVDGNLRILPERFIGVI